MVARHSDEEQLILVLEPPTHIAEVWGCDTDCSLGLDPVFKATEEIRAAQVSVKMEHSLEHVSSAVNMPDKPNCVAVSVKDRAA